MMNCNSDDRKRWLWIDSLRGLAIFMMIIYHLLFDLNFMGIYLIHLYTPIWVIFTRFIQLTFLSLVGFSLFLSFQKRSHYIDFLAHQFRRSALIMCFALLISLASYLYLGELYIRFGILHFISIAIVIGALFIWSDFILVALLLAGLYFGATFPHINNGNPFLLPFGISSFSFETVDYFPLFPWISVVCFGILWAKLFNYFNLMQVFNFISFKPLVWLGRRSLLIYLVHQPLILIILYLLGFLI